MTIDALSSAGQSLFTAAPHIGRGLEYGLTLNNFKQLEDSVSAGRNAYLTAAFQLIQVRTAAKMTDNALDLAAGTSMPYVLHGLLYITPPLLAYVLKTCSVEDDTLRDVLILLQDHIGTLCHLVSAVSAVALIVFGNPVLGSVSLVVMGIGVLDRQGILPERVRQIIHEYTQPVLVATGLLVGDYFEMVVSALQIAAYCYQKYYSTQVTQQRAAVVELPQNVLTPEIFQELLDGTQETNINRSHIHYSTLPPAPNIDIQLLCTYFEGITWTPKLTQVLRAKLAGDQRFIERHGHPSRKTDQQLVLYANASLRAYVNSVIQRQVLIGEPRDYERMHNYLKIITHILQDLQTQAAAITGTTDQEREQKTELESTWTDALLRLSIEGGEYCGPGKFEVAENLCASLIGETDDIPFRQKILNALQDFRTMQFQGIYNRLITALADHPMVAAIDLHDVHIYNQVLNLYGSDFGLRSAGAENDSAAVVDPGARLMASQAIQMFNQVFWTEVYTQHKVIQHLQEVIGTKLLPWEGVYQWWQEWITRQEISATQKDAYRAELANAQILGRTIENSYRSTRYIASDVLKAMLIDMGIFGLGAEIVDDSQGFSLLAGLVS